MCLSTSVNRNFPVLRQISRIPGISCSLLSNEACIYGCTYRRDCYNLSSHSSSRSEELFSFYPFRRCNMLRMNDPSEWLKARMILPQWMAIYKKETGISNFKTAFRTHPEEVAIPILKAYMSQSFSGNLCALWPTIAHLGNTPEPQEVTYISCDKLDKIGFLDKWLKGKDACSNMLCGDCHYCQDAYEECRAT